MTYLRKVKTLNNAFKVWMMLLLISFCFLSIVCSKSEDVKSLITKLKDKDPVIREKAALALGEMQDSRAVESLIASLRDGNPDVRLQAALALGEIEGPQAVEPLIAALKDKNSIDRWETARALGNIGTPAVEALIVALKDENSDVRESAALALGQIKDPKAVTPLVAALKDENLPDRWGVSARTLGEIGDPRAVEPLIEALKDENLNVRESAVRALGQIKDPRAVEPLVAALKDENQDVRWKAAMALAKIGTPAVEELIEALKDENLNVRENAALILGEIKDPRAVEPLIVALKDKDLKVRESAAMALGKIGTSAVEPLIAALKDESLKLQESTARAVDWHDVFESKYSDPRLDLFDATKTSPGWRYAYLPRAYLSMYRARKDTKWLDCLVVRIDNLIGEMRDTPVPGSEVCPTGECWPGFKDGFKGWGTAVFTKQYDEYLVHDGHVCVPIARFVKEVYSNPALHDKYKEKADHYLRTLEGHIIAKWYANWDARRGYGGSVRTWGGFRNLPHNQYLGFGTLLLVLYEIAQLPQYIPANPAFPDFYLRVAIEMARFFKRDLRYLEKEDAYIWLYMVRDFTYRPEGTGYGNLDLEFSIRAFRLGIVFDDKDMKRFINTFTNILWNKNEERPEFRSHIDLLFGSAIGNSYLFRWLWFYEFDPQIGQLIGEHYNNHPTRGAFSEMAANLACWQANVFEDDYQDSPQRLKKK